MTEFAIFSKALEHIMDALDTEIDKLSDLLEELDNDSGRVDDARSTVVKLQLAYKETSRAVKKIEEEDMGEEEEEDEEEEDDEETEST